MAVQVEQAFLDSLLAGLDDSVFSTPPASTQASQPFATVRASQTSIKRTPLSAKPLNTLRQAKRSPIKKSPVKPIVDEYDALLDGFDQWSDAEMDDVLPNVVPKRSIIMQRTSRQYTRFVVNEVIQSQDETQRLSKTMHVSPDGPSTSAVKAQTVILQDDWLHTDVHEGDIINILGPLAQSPLILNMSNQSNLLILLPDTLITSTAIANSIPCARKAVLQDRVRSSGPTSEALLYGNLLHELFQVCLVKNDFTLAFRTEQITKLCATEQVIMSAWELEKDLDSISTAALEKSEAFVEWAERFVGPEPKEQGTLSDPRGATEAEGQVCLSKVHDVEEDIWSPKYGLKGKVDVSVQIRAKGKSASIEEADEIGVVAPFEIKTGRSMALMEHRAQTMLYTLLMSDRYNQDILSGLLYYSQTATVIRVAQAHNELRGLIQTRNELARYMSLKTVKPATQPQPAEISIDEDEFDRMNQDDPIPEVEEHALLPDPIDQHRICKRCYANDACMLYRKAVEPQTSDYAMPSTDMQELLDAKTGHLSDQQAAFFKQWDELISHEEREMIRFKKEIWTMTADQRQATGRCMGDMIIDLSEESAEHSNSAHISRHTYRLIRAPRSTVPTSTQAARQSLVGGAISIGDPVVISMTEPDILSLARGFVIDLKPTHIVVSLDHALRNLACTASQPPTQASQPIFRIDKDELATGMGRIRDNLAQLFHSAGDSKRLKLVVDLAPPQFSSLPCTFSDEEQSLELNPDQRSAIAKVLAAKDYALILGMPGTGKTTTTAEIIQALVRRGKSVLLTSYTHSAVDNILLKLKDRGVDVLRLGNADKIMPAIQSMTLTHKGQATSTEELNERLMSPQVVATTALSVNHPLFQKRHFDYCIVDEASQITLPTCLGPLRFADTFVLVGDHNQLPPLVKNKQAREGGLDISLFRRLSEAHPEALVYLTHQYRMNEEIMSLSNTLVYENRMKCGLEIVQTRRLELPNKQRGLLSLRSRSNGSTKPWLEHVISEAQPVVFVDTDLLPARECRSGQLVYNEKEASLVCQTVEALEACGVPQTEIGVVALYRQQIKHLNTMLDSKDGIEVLTADKSQGRDKECIIMSLVRSNDTGHVGELLRDWRRLNVCLTRAKSKLIMIGSRSTLSNLELFGKLFDLMNKRDWIYQLPSNALFIYSTLALPTPAKRVRNRQSQRSAKRIKTTLGPGVLDERPILRELLSSQ